MQPWYKPGPACTYIYCIYSSINKFAYNPLPNLQFSRKQLTESVHFCVLLYSNQHFSGDKLKKKLYLHKYGTYTIMTNTHNAAPMGTVSLLPALCSAIISE
jgi:ABC-type uncharacterized transport system substrate-binding protein